MEGSSSSSSSFNPNNKRPFDHSSSPIESNNNKRGFFKTPPPPIKLSAGETLFRILCPAIKTGGVIGKGGAIIRQFREETGAKIRIDDSIPGCDERVILIIADTVKQRSQKEQNSNEVISSNAGGGGGGGGGGGDTEGVEDDVLGANLIHLVENGGSDDDVSPAQKALIRVFERILKVDEEKVGGSGGGESSEDGGGGGGGGGVEEEEKEKSLMGTTTSTTAQNLSSVVCRLLAPSNQVGCVLGRGGKIVEKIRQGSGAQVRVLPKDHIPVCAIPGDELIQITGNYSAVRKALLAVSSCLQDNFRTDAATSTPNKTPASVLRGSGVPGGQVDQFPSRGYPPGTHSLDYHSRGFAGSEGIGASHRMVPEEDIVFRMLCHLDKVGSLIGKGGSVIRALQSDTGASIKIADAEPDSDERVVLISARENSEQRHSSAQDAVIRVQSRIAEVGFEPGAAIVARLLVPSQQIGCLLGKGGSIIAEMRRSTGASIRIFPREQVTKSGAQSDEVVQAIGSLHSVQDALFQITSRLREAYFPTKLPYPNVGAPPYMSGPLEPPVPMFRPRHEPPSPGHYPHIGYPNSLEHPAGPAQHMEHPPVPMHGMDHPGVPNLDHGPYSYSNERPAYGPAFDTPSPRSWAQPVSTGNPWCGADPGTGYSSRDVHSRSQLSVLATTTVEMVIPLMFLGCVYGENNGDLNQIRQISGAKITGHDVRPGSVEGVVIVSGTSDQIHAAQSLIHAFILSGQAAA
ncbi:KH domain-containing protein HEN4-like isoform X2 [Papaver somniferum]|uniref:KH domain-containing protein HEN4-like isoform X2 n=1 Tax=Papaver somniferum TaxID=3469 RepID=UPI000E6FC654|nr:KH domain-containing protein HEN4-like isoform X2 [Papaver somniferum]